MNFKAIAFVAGIFFAVFSYGQHSHVKRGPRRLVSIDALPESAFMPGKLYIKFKPGFDSILKANLSKNKQGDFHFGIAPVDALTRVLGITDLKRSFENVLKKDTDDEQHKAWEFHRWYSIQLSKKVSVKEAIKKFQALSSVIEIAEPSYTRTLYDNTDPVLLWSPADSAYNQQWNYNHTAQEGATSPTGTDADIDLPEAWELEKGKSNVIVAVIDGGADTSHPDLRPNLWIGSGGEHFGYNWYSGSPKLEPSSHATHVCGTIAAVNNNGIGVSGIAGGDGTPGSGVRIMSMQIFNASGTYAGDEATANAFIYSADHGAAIAQNSWGGGEFSNMLTDAIDYFVMNGGGTVLNGGLVTFSAGNSGIEAEGFPGNYPPVICVTSTNYDDKKSLYSVYGSWVDIAAPGGETTGGFMSGVRKGILSTYPKSTGAYYGWLQGTSMACPHVSGVAALCISKAPGLLSNDQLRNILLNNTDDIYPLNPDYIGKLGSGRVNAFKALQAIVSIPKTTIDSVKNFSVFQSCGEAKLSWIKNDANNSVIIAASDSLFFGTPSGNLAVGDHIPGGGEIVYKGSGTSFTNQLAANKHRYFRAWSFSDTNYSFHKTVSIIYSLEISPVTVMDIAGCDVIVSWADILNCNTDSILVLANNKIPFGIPSGIMMLGDTVVGGAKVIYKGRGQGFYYTTDLDSNIYFQKWNFTASHAYTNPNSETYDFVKKPNSIISLIANSASSSVIKINWAANPKEQCFAGDTDTYMLAYSTNDSFGNPAGNYAPGDKIQGGGTVLYIGKNTSFQHSSLLENSIYCYQVWKIRNGSEYSFGKAVCSRTLCDNSSILLPFSESFDGEDLSEPDICHWELINNTPGEYPLSIVTSSSEPAVVPLKGTGMIRFNSFNIPDGSARLLSSVVKKGVGKSVDLLFRWYQDSSNYTSINYAGEGVTVQWSADKNNWNNIEFYPRVPVQGGVGWSYKQVTLPEAAVYKDTVYISFLFTSMFGNNCYLDDLKLKISSYKPSDGITRDAACESTDSSTMWTNYYDSTGDRLLSIKKNNQNIGKAGQAGFKLKVGGTTGASVISPVSNYVSNTGGWLGMNRYYAISPVSKPVQKMNIRFYYFTADFEAMANAAQLLTPAPNAITLTHAQLYGWKINDINNTYDPNPLHGHRGIPLAANYYSNGFTQYVNRLVADTTTWMYASLGNNLHSMEYTVRHLGGAGGLGIGSSNGKGALQLVTYTFTGNGNWSETSNWANNNKPPAILPSNARLIINPAGECILDTVQTIPSGAEILVSPGKKFRIKENLSVKE